MRGGDYRGGVGKERVEAVPFMDPRYAMSHTIKVWSS